MNRIKQRIQKSIKSLLIKLRIIEVKETKVSCGVEEVENGIYSIKISTR